MVFFFLVFFFVLAPVIYTPLGAIDLSLITAFGLALTVLVSKPVFDRSIFILFLLSLFLACLAFFSSLCFNEQFTATGMICIARPIKAFLVLFGAFSVVKMTIENNILSSKESIYYRILTAIYFAVVVQAVIIIVQFLSPAIRDLTYEYIVTSEVLDYNKTFRMPGLAGAGGAQLGAVQGIGFLIGMHLALFKKKTGIIYVLNALLLLSIIMTGRTGFILVGVSIAYYVYVFVFLLNIKNKWVILIRNLMFFILAGFLFSGLVKLFEDDVYWSIAFNRSFETYNNYVETGQLQDNTLLALSEMIHLPDKISTFLIGDSTTYDNTLGYYYSDIGYIRLLWAHGIVGLLGIMFFYLIIAYNITRPVVKNVLGKNNVRFGLLLLFCLFILNTKEVFFFTRMTNPMILLSTMSLYWLTYEQRKTSLTKAIYV